MKYLLVILGLAVSTGVVTAQEQTVKQMQETAMGYLQRSEYDNAISTLEKARQKEPDNIEVLRDLVYSLYLKRDFAKAVEIGKQLIEKPNADQQSYQVLGLAYKAIAEYKECAKLYRTALRKFPNSGVIYNESGELFALDNDIEEAILQWEKGIEMDPGYSSNYYNAAMFYTNRKSWLKAAIYAELFLNLESYSQRTEDIKQQLYKAYEGLLSAAYLQQAVDTKANSTFEKAVRELLVKAAGKGKASPSIGDLTGFRTRFLLQWMQGNQKTFPFRLFEQQQYLMGQGLFEAYNYWLFANSIPSDALEAWKKNHPKEDEGYKTFQQSRVFKIPQGQYYFSH